MPPLHTTILVSTPKYGFESFIETRDEVITIRGGMKNEKDLEKGNRMTAEFSRE
jgi:hypothetical protein